MIRNNGKIESCGDAAGFHVKATQQSLQSGPKEWIAPSGGRVFHNGWVKDPKMMLGKREHVTVYDGGDVPAEEAKQLAHDSFQFEDYAMLKEFGTSLKGSAGTRPVRTKSSSSTVTRRTGRRSSLRRTSGT